MTRRLPLALALLAGCAAGPRAARLDPADAGRTPPGFAPALTGGGPAPVWTVRPDPTAPGGVAVVQESADQTSYRFPMLIADAPVAADVAVTVSFKAAAGTVDQAAGLVLRYAPENYYVVRANALEDNIDLFKTVDGKRIKIDEVETRVTGGRWHTLRFAARGSHLTVAYDGRTVMDHDDATFANAGRVGLWTKADSVSAFADLRIEPLH